MFNRKSLLTLFLLSAFSLGVAACETIEGAGRDIEKAGEAVQDASD